MAVFEHPDFDNHEHVAFFEDKASGLKAIIAIHNTALGDSLGGCRMWPYKTSDEALSDVLRLSKGMTYKAAMAGLSQGGGKAVIIGEPRRDKSDALMQAMGEFVNSLGGRYVIAEDSGISVRDVQTMGQKTDFIAGNHSKFSLDGSAGDGNPAPATAYGVFHGVKAAVKYRLNKELKDVHVAIQGVGNVGLRLARHLHEAGAQLTVADIYDDNLKIAVDEFDAKVVSVDDIAGIECDVFSPCALGGAINNHSIEQIKAKVIAGAANNQLAHSVLDQLLVDKGIAYAPDYVMNAGGIIDIYHQRLPDSNVDALRSQLERIGESVTQIFKESQSHNKGTEAIANAIAEQKFNI